MPHVIETFVPEQSPGHRLGRGRRPPWCGDRWPRRVDRRELVDGLVVSMMRKLLDAIERDDISSVKSLLASGAPLEPSRWRRAWRRRELTPLQLGLLRGPSEIVKCLLDHGADPNSGNDSWLLPLAAATSNRDLAMMEVLVAHGAEVNVPHDRASPLELAAMEKRMDLVDWLLERGADPSAVFAPRVAVYRIDGRFLRRLIEAGAKAPPDLEASILAGNW